MEITLVLTTESDLIKAKNLSKLLLESRLASCISIRETSSLYWWKNQLEDSKEVQLIIKTIPSNSQKLIELIQQLHSYEVPEIIYWNAIASSDYGNWMMGEISH